MLVHTTRSEIIRAHEVNIEKDIVKIIVRLKNGKLWNRYYKSNEIEKIVNERRWWQI